MKQLIIYVSIIFPVMVACMIMMISGDVTVSYSGFGMDSSGVLYVGKDGVIEKYHNGSLIGEFSSRTSRGYAFAVQSDDTVLLSTSSTVYSLDLHGNEIEKQEDVLSKIFYQLDITKKSFKSADGKLYNVISPFGRTRIVCETGEEIFTMPLKDYIVKVILSLCGLSVFVFSSLMVYKFRIRKESFFNI